MRSFPFLLLVWELCVLLPLGGPCPMGGSKLAPGPGKADGPLENQKNPTWGHCFYPLTGLHIHTSSGWAPLREEPTNCSPKRIPRTHNKVPGNLLGLAALREGAWHSLLPNAPSLTCSLPTCSSQAWHTPLLLPCPPSQQSWQFCLLICPALFTQRPSPEARLLSSQLLSPRQGTGSPVPPRPQPPHPAKGLCECVFWGERKGPVSLRGDCQELGAIKGLCPVVLSFS